MTATAKRVLVVGADGIAGVAIVDALSRAGATVRAVTANGTPVEGAHEQVAVNLAAPRMRRPAGWSKALKDMDVVVTCIGTAGTERTGRERARTTHVLVLAMEGLWQSAVTAGVKRAVHVTPIAFASNASTFAQAMRESERRLGRKQALETIIVRTGVLFAADRNGPAARAILVAAATPGAALHTRGAQVRLSTTAAVAETVRTAALGPKCETQTIDCASDEALDSATLALKARAWLGLRPAQVLAAPKWTTARWRAAHHQIAAMRATPAPGNAKRTSTALGVEIPGADDILPPGGAPHAVRSAVRRSIASATGRGALAIVFAAEAAHALTHLAEQAPSAAWDVLTALVCTVLAGALAKGVASKHLVGAECAAAAAIAAGATSEGTAGIAGAIAITCAIAGLALVQHIAETEP